MSKLRMDERSALYRAKFLERRKDAPVGAYVLAEGWAKKHTDAKKELLEGVNERMEEGYVPVGGVNVTTIVKHAVIGEFQVILYSQGMVKQSDELWEMLADIVHAPHIFDQENAIERAWRYLHPGMESAENEQE